MSGYLIYHPRRQVSMFGERVVYHDHIGPHNQDPYIWSHRFLHSYCHITQMSPSVGDVNVWVSGDTFPAFSHLFCDLVFVVEQKVYWTEANAIDRHDRLVDSEAAYSDHYRWVHWQHQFKRRRRYTLKADPVRSFQPHTRDSQLLDVVPFFLNAGWSLEALQRNMRAGFNARPMQLGDSVAALYEWICAHASVRIDGDELQHVRTTHSDRFAV